jgi:ElaB/YqjD/DUF883 family membrane-anchored ribosome-binding protein
METNPTPARARKATGSAAANESPARTASASNEEPLGVAIEQAVKSVGTVYQRLNDALRKQTEQSPYVALGVAAGVGFLIGGGLASPLGQLVLRSSVRAFGPPLLNALLNVSASAATSPDASAADVSH